jgi:hypothetical protein
LSSSKLKPPFGRTGTVRLLLDPAIASKLVWLVEEEIRELDPQNGAGNPLWGALRIHGVLMKLGINVSERTVS